ncbi:MAG: glycosyltransferase family 2 protein [Acidimicrobiales bacterium]
MSEAGGDTGPGHRKLVSIVVPARDEEGNFARLEQELADALDPLPYDFEFIVVDNDSSDKTGALAKDLCRRDPRWRYVRFSRDFWVEASITAGYRAAAGDAIVVIYSDLQDPPGAIPALLAKWEEGYDVVYGVRTVRPGDPKWRNLAAKLSYRVITRLSDVAVPPDAGDFRLITRPVRDALLDCGEYNRYNRGLISWIGFRQVGVNYERRPRTTGRSKAPFLALIVYVFTAVTSFSLKPLRLFTAFGFVVLVASLAAIPVYVWLHVASGAPAGITTVILLLLVLIGITSLGIGILGEYLGRTHSEVKRRPLYIVAETANIDPVERGLVPRRDGQEHGPR